MLFFTFASFEPLISVDSILTFSSNARLLRSLCFLYSRLIAGLCHSVKNRGGAISNDRMVRGGPVKLDSMWQHRLTRLVRDRYM